MLSTILGLSNPTKREITDLPSEIAIVLRKIADRLLLFTKLLLTKH